MSRGVHRSFGGQVQPIGLVTLAAIGASVAVCGGTESRRAVVFGHLVVLGAGMKGLRVLGAAASVALLAGFAGVAEAPAARTASATGIAPLVASAPSVVAARVRVPNVVGFRMDRATRTLRERGLRVNEECSGLFGCIVKSRWWVCVQSPRAGRYVRKYSVVVIYGERRGEC